MNPQEELLKKAAITFSSEAISNDIKVLLSDKVSYNIKLMQELNKLIHSITSCRDPKIRNFLISDSYVKELLEITFEDCNNIFVCFNQLLTKLFKNKEAIDLDTESEQ